MDFMKVFDQTVREIKREVNLKVLKVPEIEQKVLDATDDVPWGPHGSALAEIAQATKKFSECQMVMNVLWTRLTETGKNWRLVYKALAVIEYLVAHGSDRAVDDIIEHTFQISSLTSFEYVEPSGKDVGLNVRKKAENIVAILNDRDKIQEARNKAAANRDKYFGLSSTGITYKSSSASYGSSGIQSSDRYGGFTGTRDSDSFRDGYKDRNCYGEEKTEKDAYVKSHRGGTSDDQGNTEKSSARFDSKKQSDNSHSNNSAASQHNFDDEFDDFDPRGTSTKSATGSSNQVDLFGESLIGDFVHGPTSVPTEIPSTNGNSSEVDLFADAAFVSAPLQAETGVTGANSQSQTPVDLFASQPAIPSAAPSAVDFFSATDPGSQPAIPFAAPSAVDFFSATDPASHPAIPSAAPSAVDFFSAADPAPQPEIRAPKPQPTNSYVADPFVAVPMNSFDGSDLFEDFTSSSKSASTKAIQSSATDGSLKNVDGKSSLDSKPRQKEAFQVKSGIWADSLSRGIIDLNISAPKKVSLVDVGVVGDLNDGQAEREKGPPTSFNMGRAMGMGSGLGRTGFASLQSQSQATDADDFFSNLGGQQYQFGSFQK